MDNENPVEATESNQGPDQATFLKYISKLSPEDIDKLVDIAQHQFYGDKSDDKSRSMTEYFSLLNNVFTSTNFNSIGNSPHTRNQRYEIYDEMDESTAYISSALDILSDDATQADDEGKIIHVRSDSTKVSNLVNEFIEDFELEDKVSKWARAIAKYGDLFISTEGEFGRGLTYINDTIYPSTIDRRDLNGKLVAFASNQNTAYATDELFSPWDFVHFRHKGDIYKEESSYARLGLTKNQFKQNLTSAYGQSVLRPAIKVYAQLRFVENMILLSRLTNSIKRNIFLINVGEVSPEKAFDTIKSYANLLKKDINFNIEDGVYAASKHTVKNDEDIFIPVGDPQNDVRIEQVGGNYDVKEAYDLEYLLNKLFSALKIPKAYLNYEQDLNARATLIQLDIRYARSVGQLQNTVVSGLRRMINIHLAYLGLNPDELDLDITLTPVSAIDEESRIEQQQKQISAARDMWDLLGSMKESVVEEGNQFYLQSSSEYIMKKYLELDDDVVDLIFGRRKEEPESSTRIRSGKRYSGADLHAMYPSSESTIAYEKIRESLMKTSTVPNE